ncbi:MAG: radical SAM protein [Chloroflexi bacterium]|nr:radical SAM protein [Chloroflexota bacterium]
MGIDKRNLYRLPWSLNDNPIGWLEVTDTCNLHCRGCYRQRLEGHKSLEQLKEEVRFLKHWRNCDNISIAGGECLLHPEIVEIVAFISGLGIKPHILSNGLRLNRDLMRDLKRAHLVGIGFHVDSQQGRPGWRGKNELELCEVRQQLADTVASVGGIPCGFGITAYRDNLQYIPDLIRWTLKNRKIVHGATFITYRGALTTGEYSAGDQRVHMDQSTLGYATSDSPEDIGITSADVYELIKREFPQYEACAYLGGTQLHTSIKWLAAVLVCSRHHVVGHIGPKSAEFAQAMHHFLYGTYFVYRKDLQLGKKALLLSLFDPAMRPVLGWYLRNPLRLLLEPVHGVSIGIIQAPDLLEDGRVDHCDSCPDMTYFEGKLVHSCRLDEYRKFGGLLTIAPPKVAAGKNGD